MPSHSSQYNGMPKEISTCHMVWSPWKGSTLLGQERKIWLGTDNFQPSSESLAVTMKSRLTIMASLGVGIKTHHTLKKEVETALWSLSRKSTRRFKSGTSQNSLGLEKRVFIVLYGGGS